MAALGTALGILLAAPDAAPRAWTAPLSAFLITGFGNVLNDLHDQAVDRRAHPARPLPSGLVSPSQARALAAFLLAAGLLAAWGAGSWPALLFAGAVAGLLMLYESRLKALGLAGNAAVALLTAATFPFGAFAAMVAAGTLRVPPPLVLWLAAMAFAVNLAREVAKDIEDMAADEGHRRTFPMRAGAGAARLVVLVAAACGVAASLAPLRHFAMLLSPAASATPAWAVLATCGLLVADVAVVAGAVATWANPRRGQRVLKAGMLVALAAFAARALSS